jgi:hypothetical protein
MEREKNRINGGRRIISPPNNNNGGNLKRSHAVRSSLRMLGPRNWRPPAKNLNTSDPEIKTKKTNGVVPPSGKLRRDAKDFLIDLFGKEMSENVRNKLSAQFRLKPAAGACYERFIGEQVDAVSRVVGIANVPRKAATLLQIPTTPSPPTQPADPIYENVTFFGREINQQFHFNRIHHQPNGKVDKYGCLQRTVSLIDEHQTRTATIRKGSVWANSNLSKNHPYRKIAFLFVCVYVCY